MTFRELVIEVGQGFHPDNNIDDYVTFDRANISGPSIPSYTDEECEIRQKVLDDAWDEHGVDEIYNVVTKIFKEIDEVNKIASVIN